MTKKEMNFGEQTEEKDLKTGEILKVWQSPKYIESKNKAIEMIESEKYGLSEADFWILKNKTTTGKMAYTGLIISHNGCLKINDKLENKVNPSNFTIDKDGYANSLVFTYVDEEVYEVGEFNATNGKNAYPYAMAFKRCFDRVVLKKSKLAYSGIYSEVEADEFKREETDDIEHLKLMQQFNDLADEVNLNREALYEKLGVKSNAELSNEKLKDLIEQMEKKRGK
jgi:hypothetical protein